MPHLEDRLPVNPLILQQRLGAFLQPERERESDEETNRVNNTEETEAPQPGSLANGIDRVTLSANARVIIPVQPLEETVQLPQDNETASAVREFLNVNIQRNLETDPGVTDNNVIRTGLQDLADGLQANRRADAPGTREISNRQNRPEPPALPLTPAPPLAPAVPLVPAVPVDTNTEAEPADEAAPRIGNRAGLLNAREAVREAIPVPPNAIPISEIPEEPVARAVAGFRNLGPLEALNETSAPVETEPVDFRISPALQQDIEGPRTPPARNFDNVRTLSPNLETAGNENPLIALNSVEEVLEENGAIQGPESPVFQAEAIIPAAAPIAIPGGAGVTEPDLAEEVDADIASGLTPQAPSPATPIINPVQEAAETSPDFQGNDPPPPFAGPRDAGTPGNVPLIPEPEEPGDPVQIDTERVIEESREFEALQAPAFPEVDPDEPLAFVREREPAAPENESLEIAQAPANIPLPGVNEAEPVPPPEPGNVAETDENPQALRRDNLGTDPALRSNREIRNFLQQFNANIEPPEEATDLTGGPVAEVQNNAPPPPALLENLEAIGEELLNRLREQETPEGVTRPEEERTAPPEPRTPETMLTERGQNIDRFI